MCEDCSIGWLFLFFLNYLPHATISGWHNFMANVGKAPAAGTTIMHKSDKDGIKNSSASPQTRHTKYYHFDNKIVEKHRQFYILCWLSLSLPERISSKSFPNKLDFSRFYKVINLVKYIHIFTGNSTQKLGCRDIQICDCREFKEGQGMFGVLKLLNYYKIMVKVFIILKYNIVIVKYKTA